MLSNKRTRAANFNLEEIRLLINLIDSNKEIIESKKTDAVNVKTKSLAWDKLTIAFNAQNVNNTRDTKTLKLKYECLKRDLKQKLANNKSEIFKTGGGVANVKEILDYEETLLQIIGIAGQGIPYNTDSDEISIHIQDVSQSTVQNIDHQNDVPVHIQTDINSTRHNMDAPEPTSVLVFDILKPVENAIIEEVAATSNHESNHLPKSSSKNKKINNILFNKYSNIADDRENLLQLQLQNAQLENEYIKKKIKFLEEEQELKIKKIYLEIKNIDQ